MKTRTHRHLIGLLLVAAVAPGCHERAAGGTNVNRAPITLSPEEKIASASKKLWKDANPNEEWESVAKRVLEACGGAVGMNEAFRIVENHPRTNHDWVWRGAFESALTKIGSPMWKPKEGPTCRLIRDALGETHARVISQN